MASSFSLLAAKWIPVTRTDGSSVRIAPYEITAAHDANPIVSFAWPRPDFDLAAHEFLIGLLAAAFPPKSPRDWLALYRTPPAPEEFREAFAPYAAAFSLDGEGPRFLQDFSPLEGEPSPVEALFIEAPGTSQATINKNNDLLVKRGRFLVLSRASAAMALYTLQQFAPEGGSGHRTSLRGGGPLVTLVVPGASENGAPPTLWQRLWLHVQESPPLDRTCLPLAFPWLAPTKTSENNEIVSASDASPLQGFFGMPRRIQLVFEKNDSERKCDVTGAVDEFVVREIITRPRGIKYGVWRHPLTPYYKDKTDTRPVHAPEGRLGYRQWLGLVYESPDDSLLPAKAVVEASSRLADLGTSFLTNARLFAGGYKAKSANILAFAETEMPLHAVADPELADRLRAFADQLVKAASTVASALGIAVRTALFGGEAKIDSNATLLDGPRERFWADTERPFHDLLNDAVAQLRTIDQGETQTALAERWRRTLERHALAIFDDTAPLDDFGAFEKKRDTHGKVMHKVVEARRSLVYALKGFSNSKMGRDLFNTLGLPLPQQGAGRKRKEDAPA